MTVRDLISNLLHFNLDDHVCFWLAMPDSVHLERDVGELFLTPRTESTVRAMGAKTIRDLTNLTEADLLSRPGFGEIRLAEIQRKLARWGFSLRPWNWKDSKKRVKRT